MMNVKPLVDLFYPLVELTVFDEKGKIQDIFNAFSTLKEDQECDLSRCGEVFTEVMASGRNVRCLISPYNKGFVRIRYDLSLFKNLQDQLHYLVQPVVTTATLPWNESIDQMIQEYLARHTINIQALSSRQKRELIAELQSKGLLDFKESSAYVATKLQVSRATVYNYLKTSSDFKKVRVHQVDAFTSKRFGGNPAGVVLDAENLDDSNMRKIARELNLSETAFVFPSKKAEFKMRYFTPTGHEIRFCGHSTVGALFMIAKEKRLDQQTFHVETPCGILSMETSIDKNEDVHVAYEAPETKLSSSKITHAMVANAAGFDESLIDQTYPVMYEETNKDLFVVIKSLKDLKKIECDPKSFTQFSRQHDIVALCFVSPEAFDQKNQFHMRCFAPLVGIPEDPFTGSVLGGLTAYVDTFGLLPKEMSHFRVEQGHFVERPGVVEVEFSKKRGNYLAKVIAQAVHCFSTEINLT